jgi:flagellar basal-body rod protein FlgF
MQARMDSLDMLANNIANTGTSGFKTDREFYNLYEQQLPVVERHYTDFSQGQLTPTGNPLNVALSGKGFFALNSPSGTVYTRSGDFRISKTNELETSEGYTIRNVADQGKPIKIDPAQDIQIGKDGAVQQGGQDIAKMEIAEPGSPTEALSKLGSTYYAMVDKSAVVPAAQGTEVLQGHLEQSNVPPGESIVKLVSVMRQFEMMQKAMNLSTEMNKQVIQEVAKPS